jgi:H+/gluconate symporter-like permease
VLAVAVSNKGSGYVTAPVITMTGNASKTAVLTTDTGGVPGSSTNQENAIQILAWIPTADGGSSSVIGDIVAQKGSRRMKVKTAQGTGVVTLVAAVVAAGQGTIIATDANDSTYWVTKLTSKKALLTQKVMNGSFEFASNSTAQWSFDAAELGIVQIANA